MGTRIERLRDQWTKTRSALEAIEAKASDEERELTEDEDKEVATLLTRSKDLATSIDELGQRDEAARATAAILAKFDDGTDAVKTRARVTHEPAKVTPGEYVSLYVRSLIGGYGDEGDGQADPRAAAILTRTVADQVISDNLGIVPTFIIGDVIKFIDATRYLVNIMRELPMPQGGKTFTRPRITQFTSAAQQVNEFDQASSQAMTITGDTVTKKTYADVLSLSEQDIDWTDPALLEIVVQDMAQQYAISTESAACTAVQNAATNATAVDKGGDAGAFLSGLAGAANSLYSNAKALPDVMLCATDQWAFLLGLTDTTGRQIFPTLAPMNAPGTLELGSFAGNPLGVRLVVSPEFSNGFMALGVSRFLEKYEQNKGFIQIAAPSTLSVTVAYRGYFATNVQANGLQSITAA